MHAEDRRSPSPALTDGLKLDLDHHQASTSTTPPAAELADSSRRDSQAGSPVAFRRHPGLELKGKSLPVPAWRLQRVDPEAYRHPRRTDTPMVGRESDLDLLHWLLKRTSGDRRFHLVTLLGDGGVGKTRLVDEFEPFAREHAAWLRSRSRSYGDGHG